MLWLPITIFAYLLNASSITIDKFLLEKKISNPAVYAFFISALSLLSLILMPFGFHIGTLYGIVFALIAGIFFTFALLFMFMALNNNEASRITPFMGGIQPVLVLFLAWIFIGEALGFKSIIALVFIILGTIVISWEKGAKASRKSYIFALISTLFFAIAYTMNKYVFIDQGFISGFIWTRIGAFIGALFLLFSVNNRKDIKREVKQPKKKTSSLFLVGQGAGAIGFILINYSIAISPSVALINALQGVQYIFLLLIIGTISWKFSKVLKEKFSAKILAQKLIATALIIIGLIFISI